MSAVEETLARISTQGGVESFLITDGEGSILRMSKGLSARDAGMYASQVLALTARARHAVRDLDPKVRAAASAPPRAPPRRSAAPLPPRGGGARVGGEEVGARGSDEGCAHTPPPPFPPQDDLEFFRLRTKDGREILAAPGSNSLVVVVQRWKTAADAAAA